MTAPTLNWKVFFFSAVLPIFAWLAHGAPSAGNNTKPPLVLIVSFDGFRWDYLQKTDTPNFDELAVGGVKAKYTKDVFITKTFPNHFTLVTGLFEETHGVVGNAMYDPLYNATFSMTSTDPAVVEWWRTGVDNQPKARGKKFCNSMA